MHPNLHENLREVKIFSSITGIIEEKMEYVGEMKRRFIQVYWLW